MTRFYCTVCKKVKRVRKMPLGVDTPSATDPRNREGMCNRHTMVRVPVVTVSRKVGAR